MSNAKFSTGTLINSLYTVLLLNWLAIKAWIIKQHQNSTVSFIMNVSWLEIVQSLYLLRIEPMVSFVNMFSLLFAIPGIVWTWFLWTCEICINLVKYLFWFIFQLDPEFQKSLFNLALLLANDMNRPLDSIPYIEKNLKLNPQHIKSYLLLGDIAINHMKNLDLAQKVCVVRHDNCYIAHRKTHLY